MKISNFALVKTEGETPTTWVYIAKIDVETGNLWWKKVKRVEIRRTYLGSWHFSKTGKYTPGNQVEELARVWTANTGQRT